MTRHKTAVVVAALLGLTACGDGGGDEATSSSSTVLPTAPSSSSTTSTSSGSSSSPTDGEYPIPEAATKHTKAGAKAFGEFYTRVLGEAQHRGERSLIDLNSDPSCVKCTDLGDVAEAYGEEDRRPEINPYKVTESKVLKYDGDPVVRVRFRVPSHREISSSGEVFDEIKPTDAAFAYRLKWTGKRWVATELVPTK